MTPKSSPPRLLRFIGSADDFIDGVPQAPLEVVAEPMHPQQITAARAEELIASGLYEAAKEADRG